MYRKLQLHLTLIATLLLAGITTLKAQGKSMGNTKENTMEIAFILFNDYETLDVFGPAEIFGRLVNKYTLTFYSLEGGVVSNRHRVPIMTQKLEDMDKKPDMILVPGGLGTRKGVENKELISQIKELSLSSKYVLTVCTGSALLAKTGLLDNKKATSNKRAFSWVASQGLEVDWDKKARWVIDGKYYTSSGVSAGMDMALGFLADRHGIDFARKTAKEIEYNWAEDKNNDTFQAVE
ncbi:DJ-1/PfpI family protein [Flammeovirgaceae bacterium SG7u.111]|nr:DJ-1/PfpI family protein [Flammeovirgaceae bacterium SG7u.132]WPO38014.1 DJ-1/PfpI family protein [Flammeovirgaceae bacterium SG7u.111]